MAMGTYQWKPFTLLVSAEEVKGNEMKIEAGKYYKTRDGRKVGPVSGCYPFFYVPEIHDYFYSNGRQWNTHESVNDMVSEWQDQPSPIRTVTRREIVPGLYGSLHVYNDGTYGVIDSNPDNIREAAHLLNQIAEVLQENGK